MLKLIDKKECIFLIIALVLSSILLLANLGNRYLWQDEAQTALVSKTILSHGVPLGYDGKNSFSAESENEYGQDYIWKWHPWVPFYLTALSFKLFGLNAFAARLPFALFGIATIMLTYFFAKSVTRDMKTASVATVLLMLSVPFLLLSRQCRYYSLIAFFSLLSLYGYMILLEKKKTGTIIFLISGILLFHCNHLFCALMLVTVFVHALLCHRNILLRVFALCAIVSLVNIPWIMWVSELGNMDFFGSHLFTGRTGPFLAAYFRYIHYFIFPFFLLLIPVAQALLWKQDKIIKAVTVDSAFLWKNLLLLILFIVLTIIGLLIVSPRPFLRYITQLIPVFCVIAAIIITSAIRPYFKTATVVIVILLAAVFFVDYQRGKTQANAKGIEHLNFFDYIEEITHDYDGPIEGMVKFLNENADDDDTVAITYGDMPLKFYTNLRIIGGLTGEDLTPALQADWVIVRKYHSGKADLKVKRYFLQNISPYKYERIVIDYPDILWENRPSPYRHEFRTVKDEEKVVIHRKR
ncbi:MAG: glycosyltransferase family 39 protein [Planctomycetes bacterium]|nr:glycosyltransferase family 39 protein [Planctomycetota bacterium]